MLQTLENLRDQGEEKVTMVRITADFAEGERRVKEERDLEAR